MMKNNMLKKISKLGAVVTAVVILTGGLGMTEKTYAAESKGKITVSGEGTVTVKPDVAYLNLGVTVENKDAKTAQTQNSEKMAAVIKAIKAAGVADADVQTSGYSIYPQMDYSQGGNGKITGYVVSNSVSVTVKNLDKVGEIMDKGIGAGANMGNGVQFSVADSTVYYEQALAKAISSAASKAKAVGKALNKTVGEPVEITETSGMYRPMTSAMKNVAMEAAADMPVESGTLGITANIQAVYEY